MRSYRSVIRDTETNHILTQGSVLQNIPHKTEIETLAPIRGLCSLFTLEYSYIGCVFLSKQPWMPLKAQPVLLKWPKRYYLQVLNEIYLLFLIT